MIKNKKIKILKKYNLLNPYDHNVECYSGTFDSIYKAACSRRGLARTGWMVKRRLTGAFCDVVAYRRLK